MPVCSNNSLSLQRRCHGLKVTLRDNGDDLYVFALVLAVNEYRVAASFQQQVDSVFPATEITNGELRNTLREKWPLEQNPSAIRLYRNAEASFQNKKGRRC